MIEVISFFVVIIIAWSIIRLINREMTIDEARTKGVERVKLHLKNPVLVEDYAESRGISKAEVESLIDHGKITAYSWQKYTYVENDTDII